MPKPNTATGRNTARTSRWWFVVLSLLGFVHPFAQAKEAEPLPLPVAATLKRLGLPARGLSAYVHVVGEAEPRLAVNAEIPRNPASSIKVLTTLAALEILGPAYTWKTEAWSLAPIRDGRLEGELYLKGNGDPFLVVEHFWRFLRELRNDGLTEIRGGLVLDQSHFAPAPEDPAEFDGRPTRAYNVQPAALLVNFQTVRFHLLPQPYAKRVRIIADPHPTGLEIVNRVELVTDHCREGLRRLGMQAQTNGRERVVFSGRYDAACGEHEIFRVVSEPTEYIHGVFQAYWREQGGRFDGGVRVGRVPEVARLLHVQESPPLADIVRSVNKYSNNVMTRQLLLTLGARSETPGTEEKGIAEVRRWLAARGLDFPELVLENGSGLSREERISARHLGELLLAGYASPFMPEFLSSLPISAMDGTLKRRFGGTPLEGRLHLKSGSLDGVRSMAGYLLDAQGRRVVVVALHNDDRLHTAGGEAVQEALLKWAYDLP
jgi:D-alanyl-D-alanine carboxypeptidase/D-alanyl-D-alanine-endopeptidase (penicillin-binding protein 4)